MTMLAISSDELGLLVLCALRYAMGRKSYITSSIAEIIETRWDDFTSNDKVTILRDLERALSFASDSGKSLGMSMDDAMWRGLLERLKAR